MSFRFELKNNAKILASIEAFKRHSESAYNDFFIEIKSDEFSKIREKLKYQLTLETSDCTDVEEIISNLQDQL